MQIYLTMKMNQLLISRKIPIYVNTILNFIKQEKNNLFKHFPFE